MVDNSKPRDEGYVIDEPGGVVGVPTEDRTSSPPIVSAATQPSQHGIMSSQSPVPEATDTVTSQNEPRDPQVASLRSIFPDYDEAILCVFSGFSSTDGLIAHFTCASCGMRGRWTFWHRLDLYVDYGQSISPRIGGW